MELKDIRKEYLDYAKALQPLREAHAHRVRMYVGDQWADVKPRPKKNRPQSVINFYKRHVDVLYGYILANRTDLKLHPVEGADDLSCDIRSRLLQWIFSDRNYYTNFCLGAQDAFIGGMGWVAIDRVFDYDLINGDICVYQTQFDEILHDPYMREVDASDCNVMFRRKYIPNQMAAQLWPEFEKELLQMSGRKEMNFAASMTKDKDVGRDKLNIVEKWYKDPVKKIVVIDQATQMQRILDTDNMERAVAEASRFFAPEQLEKLIFKPKTVNEVKLIISAEDELELYNGPHPDGVDRFPFIPILGYYTPSASDWDRKCQGVAEVINDLQMEINKLHSSIMYKLRTKSLDGYTVLEDAGVNTAAFEETDSQFLPVPGHDVIKQIPQAEMPNSLFTMFTTLPGLLPQISHNPDLLAISEQSKSSSGVAMGVQLRQAMTIVQQVMSNFSTAYQSAGLYVNELVSKHFTQEKVARILGEDAPYAKDLQIVREQIQVLQQVQPKTSGEAQAAIQQAQPVVKKAEELEKKITEMWEQFEESRYSARYDCRIGEVETTPTHRMAMVALFEKMMHQGQDVPMEVFVQYLEMPKDIKEQWLQSNAQKQQTVAQMQEQQNQMIMAIEQLKAESKLQQQQLANLGKLQVEAMKQEERQFDDFDPKAQPETIRLGEGNE